MTSSTPTPPAYAATLFGDNLDKAIGYHELLATAGYERGFIGPREVPRLWDRHILNCAIVAEILHPDEHLVDVGSGAGLPGIPLAIARPDLQVDLVESLLKRSVFLTEVVDTLQLDNVRVIRGRAEDPEVIDTVGGADVATSRAVAPLATLVGYCMPLIHATGRIDALKGETAAAEISRDSAAITRLGGNTPTILRCGEHTIAEPATVVRITKNPRRTKKR
ncbi:16S rRNA (guanine(527)-N(7))-methyltransferase RsmG [Corynebacterium choanae]|uniref:Ribosomal RNA small subunit methyltransferase G n=1 Tax=Corynebacterium choanae TaxID=1862358 RepID=A0A3G6J9J3_9CORY|nr:16S rRNA (guanine(527)-N(7))-methyltransferase RsmG [Corynebacterium choanae]AZA14737.1 Ribosomal RNA small subunit methyltransferase G [Corynebacterium choanae]